MPINTVNLLDHHTPVFWAKILLAHFLFPWTLLLHFLAKRTDEEDEYEDEAGMPAAAHGGLPGHAHHHVIICRFAVQFLQLVVPKCRADGEECCQWHDRSRPDHARGLSSLALP